MMRQLQKYPLNVVYKKGTQMYISDHLSRSALPHSQMAQKEREMIMKCLRQCGRRTHERD